MVSDSLKERFGEYIDQRTALGVAKYGQPLHTHDGRDTAIDMADELLDFCQYQEKSRKELLEQRDALAQENRTSCGPRLASARGLWLGFGAVHLNLRRMAMVCGSC